MCARLSKYQTEQGYDKPTPALFFRRHCLSNVTVNLSSCLDAYVHVQYVQYTIDGPSSSSMPRDVDIVGPIAVSANALRYHLIAAGMTSTSRRKPRTSGSEIRVCRYSFCRNAFMSACDCDNARVPSRGQNVLCGKLSEAVVSRR